MRTQDIQTFVEREPFRPFSVQLSNGAKYDFTSRRQVGAPEDCHVLVFFGEKELVLIDPENVAEIMDRR